MKLTPNFSLQEFSCNDDANTPVPPQYLGNVTLLAKNLQVLRDHLGERVVLNSGYRTPEYNKSVGGKKLSQHLTASAADITVKSKSPKELRDIIESLITAGRMKQGGLGLYPGFVHYDIRGRKSRW